MYTKITAPYQGVEKNRWLDGLTNEEHHAMKCISSSSIKFRNAGLAAVSPKTFYSHCVLKEQIPFEPNEAFRVGTIAHLAVLEPERFEKSVIVCDLNQNTNDFKNFKINISQDKIEDKNLNNKIESIQKELKYYIDICGEDDVKCVELSNQLIELQKQKKETNINHGFYDNCLNHGDSIKFYENKIEELEEELKESSSKEQSKVIKDKIKQAKKDLKDSRDIQKEQVDNYQIKYTKDGGILTEKGQEIFIVKSEEMKMYRAFQTQVEKHPRISFLMQDCIFEQSGIAQDPITGLWLSVRGDARNPRGYFLDPKTMADYLSVKSIEKYFSDYNLALQDGAYTYTANLIEPGIYKKFFFIMMSKKPPYEIALVQLDNDDRKYGMEKFKKILQDISECELSGKWPALDAVDGNHGLTIKLPPWSRK